MALGTGSEEFFVMLVAYAIFLPVSLFLVIKKWRRRNGKSFTVVEAFVLLTIIYCAIRIVTISFLLYLAYGYLPKLRRERNTPRYNDLLNLGNYYIVTWDILFLIGTLTMYSLLSIVGFKIRVLLTGNMDKELRVALSLAGLFNAIAWVGSLAIASIQWFDVGDRFMIWIHVAYCYAALHLIISSLISANTAESLSKSILAYGKDGNYTRISNTGIYHVLIRTSFKVKVCLYAGAAFACTRAGVLVFDAIMYRYINTRTDSIQVVWNIVFKYILWVIPELLTVISYGLGVYEMQYMSQVLSFIKQTALKGQSLGSTEGNNDEESEFGAEEVEVEQLEDVLKGGNVAVTNDDFKHLEELDEEEYAENARNSTVTNGEYSKI